MGDNWVSMEQIKHSITAGKCLETLRNIEVPCVPNKTERLPAKNFQVKLARLTYLRRNEEKGQGDSNLLIGSGNSTVYQRFRDGDISRDVPHTVEHNVQPRGDKGQLRKYASASSDR